MASVRTLAIVVRSVDVMETSKVVTLATRDLGKVAALAKGARRLKSPYQAALDLLSVCDIVLLHKASDALDLVTEAALVERFDSLRRDLAALYAGYYIAELLADLTDLNDPHPRLFDAARVTLRHLGERELRPKRLLRFELACLRELGLMPALEACVHCGAVVEVPEGSKVGFALAAGGVLCAQCRPGQPHVADVTGHTLAALRVLGEPGNEWRELDLAGQRLSAVRGTTAAMISHVLGRPPRLLPYLGGGA